MKLRLMSPRLPFALVIALAFETILLPVGALAKTSGARAKGQPTARLQSQGGPLTVAPVSLTPSITNYTAVFNECDFPQRQRLILIRTFNYQNTTHGFFVNPMTLKTGTLSFEGVHCHAVSASFAQTPYAQLLVQSRLHDSILQDSGVTRSALTPRLMLTVDLCPSSRSYEADFFANVLRLKLPVALSLSGGWVDGHGAEFAKLKALQAKGVDVTWINHSLHHPYLRSLPDARNFFLMPNVNVTQEVLGNEVKMLENGVMPSIYFRFPGLVSDRQIVEQVIGWGLVPLGADAWLALGEHAHAGSIILVHGNGNEPYGIRLFMQNLSTFLSVGFASLSAGFRSQPAH